MSLPTCGSSEPLDTQNEAASYTTLQPELQDLQIPVSPEQAISQAPEHESLKPKNNNNGRRGSACKDRLWRSWNLHAQSEGCPLSRPGALFSVLQESLSERCLADLVVLSGTSTWDNLYPAQGHKRHAGLTCSRDHVGS